MTLEEGTAYSESTGARNGLGDGYSVLFDGGRVGAIGEESGGLGEVGNTSDAGVLLIKLLLDDLLLGGLN